MTLKSFLNDLHKGQLAPYQAGLSGEELQDVQTKAHGLFHLVEGLFFEGHYSMFFLKGWAWEIADFLWNNRHD